MSSKMPLRRLSMLILAGLSVVLLSFLSTSHWKIISGTEADFEIKYWAGKVKGSFDFKDSKITFDPNHLKKAQMDVTLDVGSIKTGIGMRDKDLRGDDYFDAEKYPLMKFHSTDIDKGEKGGYVVVGDLTIKDVTKSVSIPFSYSNLPNGNGLFEGSFTLNRLDYHVGGKKKSMGDEVTVSLKVPVEAEK